MQKTTLLDFVTKLSQLSKPQSTQKTQEDAEQIKQTSASDKTDNPPTTQAETDNTFMRSYNPFEQSLKERSQLSMPRAQKPTKDKIDLSLCKSKPQKGQSDSTKNMIDLINRHNAFCKRIQK